MSGEPMGINCCICGRPILRGEAHRATLFTDWAEATHSECERLSEQTASLTTAAWYNAEK